MSDDQLIGPVLFLDDLSSERLHLAALFLAPPGTGIPPIETDGGHHPVEPFAEFGGLGFYRARFSVSANHASDYRWSGETFQVASGFDGDLRLAYVSCNGQEKSDLERPRDQRNAMWQRLCDEHDRAPFSALLHGGDQIYADEITDGHLLTENWPDDVPADPDPAALADLEFHLAAQLVRRYRTLYAAGPYAYLSARIPSLAMWDDHDICDGWGSLDATTMGSAVGQCLFRTTRQATLLFQNGCTDGDLPGRFLDRHGGHLGWAVGGHGLRIIAPDLRSERTRTRVMGPAGWADFRATASPAPGQTFLMSSTPLLGPRLSLLETLMPVMPARIHKYEDDLRDQWQSHAHRTEWREMLQAATALARPENAGVTVLSGEIHLATRATLTAPDGVQVRQLVASGISHPPPPRGFARALGALAGLGSSPMKHHRIRIAPLPGRRRRYTAERNFMTLSRSAGTWQARWHLEESGTTDALPLS
ncbi:MAG: alkaline phosphatase family protein [Pseudomonadota bacterium]